MQSSTSLTLLARLRSDDQRNRELAWERFVKIYTPLLMQWAAKQGFQVADAADLTQELMLKLMSRLQGYERREGASFRAWLITLLRNQGIDYRRRKATRKLELGEVENFDIPASFQDFEKAEYNQWVINRGLELIRDDFSEETWRAFRGVLFDGKSATAVAAELGVTVNAVYLSRHRVLARLREELADFVDEC